MDPNANLKELRELVASILKRSDDDEGDAVENALAVAQEAERMAELVEALDGWITRGGFLPAAWQKGRAA